MRILVVDDSRAMRKIVIRAVRGAPAYAAATMLEAADGREALEVIASERPDVVLSDWNMPEVDGLELLARLRRQGDPTPVGFITSESAAESHARALAGGARFVVSKPFTAEALVQSLGKVV